jgi:Domain of unknown function (DUF4190)/Septum formation
MRFNPPPGWPPLPGEGFVPGPDWRPDPSWPPAPPGWEFWLPEDREPAHREYGADAGLQRIFAPYSPESSSDWHIEPPSSRYRQAPPAAASGLRVGPPPSVTSGMAVTAFVLGLLGVLVITAILGIVFGVVALRGIRASLQRGRGLAIAGIVLGSAWLALAAVLVASVFILRTATPAQPSASASTHAGSRRVNVLSLRGGDCFDYPAVTPGQVTKVVSVLQTTCTEPHNAQIFATFTLAGSILDYPGNTSLASTAVTDCSARIKAALNSVLITKTMTLRFLVPEQLSWVAGNRTISCVIYSPTAMRSSVLKG